MARVRQGDERAFELLYERHVPGILSFSRHMLGDSGEAEDTVQHVFTAAHAELVSGTRQLALKAWLYTVARNRCLSVLRGRRERPSERLELSTDGLQDEVQRRADVRELLADLQDLPEHQRAALVLSELDDLSHAQIAEVLDCPAGNVKGLVFRARAGLMERHEAREAPCEEIRTELAAARRGGLRRGRLRHHVSACPDCSAFLEDLRRQRRLLAVALPVLPSAGLKQGVLASIGLGGGAAAGGIAALGTAGTAATVAAAAVIAGGAGLIVEAGSDPDAGRGGEGRPAQKAAPPQRPGRSGLRPAVGGVVPLTSRRERKQVRGPHRSAKNRAAERAERRESSAPGQSKTAKTPNSKKGSSVARDKRVKREKPARFEDTTRTPNGKRATGRRRSNSADTPAAEVQATRPPKRKLQLTTEPVAPGRSRHE